MLLLADTSAWHHARRTDAVLERWTTELMGDRLATTPPVRLEVLFSAQSAVDVRETAQELDALHQVQCGPEAMGRAETVQGVLAERGGLHHRSVKPVDLLVAAAAELSGATVWHYDADYDRIAEVTGQPVEWIAPRGSL